MSGDVRVLVSFFVESIERVDSVGMIVDLFTVEVEVHNVQTAWHTVQAERGVFSFCVHWPRFASSSYALASTCIRLLTWWHGNFITLAKGVVSNWSLRDDRRLCCQDFATSSLLLGHRASICFYSCSCVSTQNPSRAWPLASSARTMLRDNSSPREHPDDHAIWRR